MQNRNNFSPTAKANGLEKRMNEFNATWRERVSLVGMGKSLKVVARALSNRMPYVCRPFLIPLIPGHLRRDSVRAAF